MLCLNLCQYVIESTNGIIQFFTFVMPSCEIPYQIYGCNYGLFFSILERFDYCTNLNEQFCTYIKHLMRINPEKFKIFLNDLIKMINSIFNHHLDSSCLYLLRGISDLYYRELYVYNVPIVNCIQERDRYRTRNSLCSSIYDLYIIESRICNYK